MKRVMLFSIMLLFLVVSISGRLPQQVETSEKPNIVIVLADDMGWGDVGYHGSDIQTPNLDQLAAQGIKLHRFYVAPICTPTRAGLLTGKYPNRFGVRKVVIPPWRDFGIEPEEIFLPEVLAEAGYKHRTVIGKWHLGHSRKKYHPLEHGFSHFYGHYNGAIDYFTLEREGELDWHYDWESSYDTGYATDLIAEHAVKCINTYSDEEPFFLYVAFNAPHTPLQAKDEDMKLYGFDESKPRFGKDKRGHGNTPEQTYAAMVTSLDRGVGEIYSALEENGAVDNTIFLFFSDNGADENNNGGESAPLRGHKFHEFEGGVRVPAFISWPDELNEPRTINQVTGFVDIMPTLIDILGVQTDAEMDGISILPVLKGEKELIDRYFYLGLGATVSQEWKYIAKGHNNKMNLESDQLFKIDTDPYEEENVIHIYTDVLEEIREVTRFYDEIEPKREVPPFREGRDGFVAPKEWKIENP